MICVGLFATGALTTFTYKPKILRRAGHARVAQLGRLTADVTVYASQPIGAK